MMRGDSMRTIFSYGVLWMGLILSACGNNTDQKGRSEQQKKDQAAPAATTEQSKTIIFYGNSLTAGYGVDPSEAFPALVQNIIDSVKLGYKVINAGLSGETTAGGRSRIDWILRQPVNVFVL